MTTNQIGLLQEVARKLIHISSLAIPALYYSTPHDVALMILVSMTVVSLLIDVAMQRNETFRQFAMPLIGPLLRPHEQGQGPLRLNGASWVLISATLCVLVFPKLIMMVAFTVLIISDTSAALVGRTVKSRRFIDKSLAGFSAFIVSGTIVVFVYALIFGLTPSFVLIGVLSVIIGGIVESSSIRLKLDDNLSIPGTVGSILWLSDILVHKIGFSGILPVWS